MQDWGERNLDDAGVERAVWCVGAVESSRQRCVAEVLVVVVDDMQLLAK